MAPSTEFRLSPKNILLSLLEGDMSVMLVDALFSINNADDDEKTEVP